MAANTDTESLRSQVEDNPALSLEPLDADDARWQDRAWSSWQKLLDGRRLRQIDLIQLSQLLNSVYARGVAAGREGSDWSPDPPEGGCLPDPA